MTALNPLSAASLAIYILLLQPTLYILFRHGRPGFLGWGLLQIFCLLRLIGGALSLHTPSSGAATLTASKSTLIVNNIGLSPLLLATAGILHEARRARNPRLKGSLEWGMVIQYHLLVSGALGLVVAGVVIFEGGKVKELGTAAGLLKAGAAVVLVCWGLLVAWTGVSFRGLREQGALDYGNGSKLLYTVVIALPLIALRLVYGVASLLLVVTGHSTSRFTTSLAIKVVLSTVPEMVLVVVFIVVGVATRNIAGAYWRKSTATGQETGKV